MTPAGLASILPIPVTIPLAAAALCPLVGRLSRRVSLIIGGAALAASAAVLALYASTVYGRGGRVVVDFMGRWGPVGGKVLGDAFAADPLGLDFALAAAAVGAVILLFTLSSLTDLGAGELGQFTALFLLLDAALIGSALTADLLNLFVWFEVAALASYALTAFFLERPPALEAAFKILVLTNIASFIVFIGTALIYERTGAVDFAQIHRSLGAHAGTADSVALGLLLAGFATKAGMVPFHSWLPDAHTAAPGPVSALFSGLMVNLGIVAIARIVFLLYSSDNRGPVLGLLMVLGLVSAVGGASFALFQDDLKRLLAYDTVSQMGVLAVGLASAQPAGLAGAAYHLIDHTLFKTLLFLCAGTIVHVTGEENLSEMGGLWRRMPAIAIGFVVGALAIAGVPPLNGYAGVGLIHDALLDSHQYIPLVIVLVAQVVTIAALGKAAWMAFFKAPAKESFERDESLRPGMITALVALGAGCLTFGVLPGYLIPDVAAPAASTLLHPAAYAADVLAGGGRLPALRVSFDYFNPRELLTVAATVILAYPVGRAILSGPARPVVTKIRKVMSGSVNDYASYLVAGVVATVATLLVR